MIDILIRENLNGGDAVLLKNDLLQTSSWHNMIYLAWFGGNPGHPTRGNEVEGEERFDWWGNSLFFPNDVGLQFNSLLENTLNTVSLNSEGLRLVEEAALQDLQFMRGFANIDLDIYLHSDDRIHITVYVTELSTQENQIFKFIWDSTKNELEDGDNESLPLPNNDDGGKFSLKFSDKYN